MRDDRDPPVHPMHPPTRPQLGARPFTGGRSATSRPAPASSTPSRSPRPFVPRHVARATDPGAERIDTPGVPDRSPEAAPFPAPTAPVSRRTPRMLAALVQAEQVAIWPVDATLEQPALPVTPNEPERALTEWPPHASAPSGATPGQDAATADAVDRATASAESASSTGGDVPHDVIDAPLEADEADEADEAARPGAWMHDPATPSVDSFLAEPAPEMVPEPSPEPAAVSMSQPIETIPSDDSATETARIIEAIAARVRNGEIVVANGPHARGKGSDAAVLAAVLASLLGGHNER